MPLPYIFLIVIIAVCLLAYFFIRWLVRRNGGAFNAKKWLVPAIVLVLAVVVVSQMFGMVPVGHTGILLTFGKVQNAALSEGLNFKLPFVQRIISMDNRIKKLEVETAAFSKDLQTIKANLALNYALGTEKTFEVYRTIGLQYETVVIIPLINEVLKSASAGYTAVELVGTRQKVSDDIMSTLESELARYGIRVIAFNILDFDFSDAYIQAIENKQVAEENKKRIEIENQTAIQKAEADKKVAITNAQAEAEKKRLSADAEAYALAKQRAEITSDLLTLRLLEKWDGKLPTLVGGNSNGLDLLLPAEALSDKAKPE